MITSNKINPYIGFQEEYQIISDLDFKVTKIEIKIPVMSALLGLEYLALIIEPIISVGIISARRALRSGFKSSIGSLSLT